MALSAPETAHGAADWENMHDIIAKLYSHPGLGLKEVMLIMEQEHNFKATQSMYKKRLRQWGLFRNVTGDQRRELVELARTYFDAGLELPTIDSNGKSIPWERVKRSCLRDGQHLDMWQSMQIKSRRSIVKTGFTDRKSVFIPEDTEKAIVTNWPTVSGPKTAIIDNTHTNRKHSVPLPRSPSYDCIRLSYQPHSPTREVDAILSNIINFQTWRVAIDPQIYQASQNAEPVCQSMTFDNYDTEVAAASIINSCMDVHRYVLKQSWTRVKECLNKIQVHFDQSLADPDLSILCTILVIYLLPASEDIVLQAIKRHLVSRFRNSCHLHLGLNHPLTKVLDELRIEACESNSLWAVAIFDCTASTEIHPNTNDARIASIHTRVGLALALDANGYSFSAALVLRDIVHMCSTFTHAPFRQSFEHRAPSLGTYWRIDMHSNPRSIMAQALPYMRGVVHDKVLQRHSIHPLNQERSKEPSSSRKFPRKNRMSVYLVCGKDESSDTYCAWLYYDFMGRVQFISLE